MKIVIYLFLLCFINYAHAESIYIDLLENKNGKTHSYYVDLDSFKVVLGEVSDDNIPDSRTGKYSIKNEALYVGGHKLFDANELLFEAKVDGKDIVVIRDEYNSFSNPLKWLSAVVGHPVQTSKIYILEIESKSVINKLRLQKQDSSYRWKVEVYSAN
ncbi:hypothetical protein HHE94_01790 [Pseudoalteromonas arctica]|uniref:Uncharacterized protein n=1 Tax=Pseudoalteromonas arctica TaxID=394751 RepID=A0AAP7CJI4_9GAMM|nr:hypothetical protein [Pseudoalteromonas arctica]NMP01458.1 hypothetical protein [Pseudoalteromonas arctica]